MPENTPVAVGAEGLVYQGAIAWAAWVDARDLKPGYHLLNPDDTWAEVVEVKRVATPLTAYNLTVEEFGTFFVAANVDAAPVWVHNACQLPTEKLARAAAKTNGWVETNYLSHGRKVFRDPKSGMYYSADEDGHNGGYWKGAKSLKALGNKQTRTGTYDQNLKWIEP